ncbi:hypothetical protein OIU34_38555 [Pararhizobium sp. BT-229]|uniref:hypothetical protein n=1 Tax=Pararhizobium sp. BT-229 TaxID=2986923 RepID=UPI0021F6C070|nr:hypothetical protein [Pararhizobium sp. BT-229]MCV9967725.1 hypothetical protein [Pararhizobium sp. BT-229]
MAKNNIPKKVAGYKVPKAIRKSTVIRALLASDIGRSVLASALTAGAGAAAAVLIAERQEIADTATKGARKGARAIGIVGEAMRNAAYAATEVVRDAVDSGLPKKVRRAAEKAPRRGAAVHKNGRPAARPRQRVGG